MKNALYFLLVVFISTSCLNSGPDPYTLANSLNNNQLASYLSGKWNYALVGKGNNYWSETLTFDKYTGTVTRSIISNSDEVVSNPAFLDEIYDLYGEGTKITLYDNSGFKESFRIEQTSPTQMKVFPIVGQYEQEPKVYKKTK